MVSRFECVGAGDLQDPENRVREFASAEDAEAWLAQVYDHNTRRVRSMIETIEASSDLIFESPFIVSVIWIAVPTEAMQDGESAVAALGRVIQLSDDVIAAISGWARGQRGRIYTDVGDQTLSLDETLESISDGLTA